MQWLYLNGDLVKSDEASIPALDPAVFHGRALIETFATRNGNVFRLRQHHERLSAGGPVLGITIPLSLTDLEAAVADVLRKNRASDARMRLTVSHGPSDAKPSVTLTALPLTDYTPELYERGMHSTIAEVRRNETSPLSRIKCAAGLLDGLLAREAARAAGFDEAILLNTRGSVAEATVANVFIMRNGRLLTPDMESGALPGVTRAAILDQAREAGIEATETEISLDELLSADEAFLTNSIMGVMPLTKVQNQVIQAGPITIRLVEALHRAASGE
jgi:branched-chain amino acid aminotransferase